MPAAEPSIGPPVAGPLVLLFGALSALTVLLDWLLVDPLGVVGLALAFAMSCAMIMSAALVWLARRAGDLRWRLLVNSSWRLGLTSLAMAATAFGTSRWLETLNPGSSRWGLVLNLAVSSMFGLGVFVALESMMRLEAILELQTLAKEVWTTRVRPS